MWRLYIATSRVDLSWSLFAVFHATQRPTSLDFRPRASSPLTVYSPPPLLARHSPGGATYPPPPARLALPRPPVTRPHTPTRGYSHPVRFDPTKVCAGLCASVPSLCRFVRLSAGAVRVVASQCRRCASLCASVPALCKFVRLSSGAVWFVVRKLEGSLHYYGIPSVARLLFGATKYVV